MFNTEALIESFGIMGYGMLGIFIVIGIIIGIVFILNKSFPGKK